MIKIIINGETFRLKPKENGNGWCSFYIRNMIEDEKKKNLMSFLFLEKMDEFMCTIKKNVILFR